jgi:hypothetical protein
MNREFSFAGLGSPAPRQAKMPAATAAFTPFPRARRSLQIADTGHFLAKAFLFLISGAFALFLKRAT